jgi:haloacetate dehalogenase
MLERFERRRVATSGAEINLVLGGGGPPVLLLHGYPQNLAMWHKLAPRLAERYTVVAADLRGYGDSAKPPAGDDHAGYCKRVMARDQAEAMAALGFESFHVVGHDRGARVGYRLAYDDPARVRSLGVLDVVPTGDIFAAVDAALAEAYFHWFLMLQPAPLAERLIGADPEFWLRWLLERWCTVPGAIAEEAFAEYLRCFRDPATLHAMCEDYRSAPLDVAHDEADRGRLACPVLVLWGADQGNRPGWPSVSLDILESWRTRADDVLGRALACGHFLPEEAPEETAAELIAFLDHAEAR